MGCRKWLKNASKINIETIFACPSRGRLQNFYTSCNVAGWCN